MKPRMKSARQQRCENLPHHDPVWFPHHCDLKMAAAPSSREMDSETPVWEGS
jgi:hypothetical protein